METRRFPGACCPEARCNNKEGICPGCNKNCKECKFYKNKIFDNIIKDFHKMVGTRPLKEKVSQSFTELAEKYALERENVKKLIYNDLITEKIIDEPMEISGKESKIIQKPNKNE
ncbi:MAG: hypothetical protein EAX89_15455 [Candidatus Lokiarchaeota archaeon]|nr:hypothetical protein [Candidatus Lokiarchaeota archaeon]